MAGDRLSPACYHFPINKENKKTAHPQGICRLFILFYEPLYVTLNLAGAQAACAGIDGTGAAVDDSANTLGIRSPRVPVLVVCMADQIAAHGAFFANFTIFAHSFHLLGEQSKTYEVYHIVRLHARIICAHNVQNISMHSAMGAYRDYYRVL